MKTSEIAGSNKRFGILPGAIFRGIIGCMSIRTTMSLRGRGLIYSRFLKAIAKPLELIQHPEHLIPNALTTVVRKERRAGHAAGVAQDIPVLRHSPRIQARCATSK